MLNYSLPTGKQQIDTPAPEGKKPFYISHFGSSAAYYLESLKEYDMPINTLVKADSVKMLTPLGKDVLRRLRLIRQDALHRTGEMTVNGARQMRQLAQEMVDRFPDIFVDGSYVDARSIVRNHSIMSMQEFMTQIARHKAKMELRLKSSHSNDPWMYVRDKELEADGRHVEGEVLGRDVLVDMKVAAVANLHHVDVGVGEGKLLFEGYLLGVLHGVAESGGKLLEVVVGVAVVGADKAVEGVEGVEEEVGTDLLLEGLVAGEYVLGLELLVFEDKLLTARDVVEEEGN